MTKVVLTDITSGYDLSKINANFEAIEEELNNRVMYKDNVDGSAETLHQDVDANGKRIYNLPAPQSSSEPARLEDVQNAVAGGAANLISNAPAGNISATTVQGAINELDAEKLSLSTLAANNGASLVGFKRSGSSTVAHTVEEELTALAANIIEFGASTGATDNASAVTNAAAASRDVRIPDGDFLISALSNIYGSTLKGPGRLLKSITGGYQQLNSYADINQHVFGREYLSAFLDRVITGNTCSVVLTGDSTTAGTATSGDWMPDALLKELSFTRGAYDQKFYNRGQPGKHSGDWQSTYLAGDLTAAAGGTAPHLMVVRWGINDPYYGRSVSDYITTMRACLSTIRTAYNVQQVSILLMAPNSTSDTPNSRDERWYEQIVPALRQMARDFQCCFFDTYALYKDARGGAAGKWLDNPYGDGRGIHPLNVLNAMIYTGVADLLYPEGIAPVASNRLLNLGANDKTVALADLPASFDYGVTISRTDNTWPYDGAAMTIRQRDGTYCLQVNWGYNNASTEIAYRVGQLGTWYSWRYLGQPSVDLTLINSWVTYDVSYSPKAFKNNGLVCLEGLIKSGTMTSGTTITTLPVGYRPPRQNQWFACTTDTAGQTARVYVHTNGQVIIHNTPSNGFVSLDGIKFLA